MKRYVSAVVSILSLWVAHAGAAPGEYPVYDLEGQSVGTSGNYTPGYITLEGRSGYSTPYVSPYVGDYNYSRTPNTMYAYPYFVPITRFPSQPLMANTTTPRGWQAPRPWRRILPLGSTSRSRAAPPFGLTAKGPPGGDRS